ncbi:MAG TPA: DUF1848 family protein [Syntrophomonadaceae bacterium]|nr:DUF1848 family protein [Syntrophomonadaceae bacterium]
MIISANLKTDILAISKAHHRKGGTIMILNISGRTDIVNHYSDWLFNRFEEGYVYSRNSLFPNSVRRYELIPEKLIFLFLVPKITH